MGKLIYIALSFFASNLIKQALLGAGLGILSGAFVLTLVNQYINEAVTSMSSIGSVGGLMGLAGLDVALSIVIGAVVCRATISSLSIRLTKS
jgi:hypothetical protein